MHVSCRDSAIASTCRRWAAGCLHVAARSGQSLNSETALPKYKGKGTKRWFLFSGGEVTGSKTYPAIIMVTDLAARRAVNGLLHGPGWGCRDARVRGTSTGKNRPMISSDDLEELSCPVTPFISMAASALLLLDLSLLILVGTTIQDTSCRFCIFSLLASCFLVGVLGRWHNDARLNCSDTP